MRLHERFSGNVPALVTPCTIRGEPDHEAMHALVEHVIASGVSAVCVLGTTGEFSLVAPRHRAPVIRAAVEAAANRVPVMAGCGRPSIVETEAEIAEAATCGATAALVTPSYYFPLTEPEIVNFFSALAERSLIPILYYHYPQMTRCSIGAAAILTMARSGVIAGIKDSSGDAAFFARLTARATELDDFRIFIGGSGFLLAALSLGAHGVMGALSNFAAHLDNELIAAFSAGDVSRCRRAQAEIVRAVEALFHGVPRNPAATSKVILASMGICGDSVFAPLAPLTESEKAAIIGLLPSFGIAAHGASANRKTAAS